MNNPSSGSVAFKTADFSRGAIQVVEGLQKAGFAAYIVGGAIRDLLLGQHPKDFDVATDATPEQIKQCFRSARVIGRRFQIVHVRAGAEIIEVTTFRGHHSASQNQQNSKAAESGRLLRDNVYGTLEEDALRRDLTINALYYDFKSGELIDELGGAEDISRRLIRVIGDPEERYREDPVRMLRVVRFAARLNFDLESATEAAIEPARHLLREIPAARLFDEWLKLFMNGYSAPTYSQLEQHRLLEALMGEVMTADGRRAASRALQQSALRNTDRRVAEGRPVTPAFLLAALLWPATEMRSQHLEQAGESPLQAIHSAGQQIVAEVCHRLSIPRRFSLAMRDIWDLQPRLMRTQSKKATDIVAQRWFRAAYDLLLLREETEAMDRSCSQVWSEQQQKYPELVGSARAKSDQPPRRRGRGRRRPKAP